uniref:Flavonol synthase n=1 Tax=Muscari aucheri TaxID=928064 RepID=A0A5J6A7Y0_9ASPA|nr:flavonol synthase [Muscari aucheri]
MDMERVQAIASLAGDLGTIPAEFIRPEHERPAMTTHHGPSPEIPVVDMTSVDRVKAIADAAKEWGIFQLVNHGIPVAAIEELKRVGTEFFALPQEEKESYAAAPGSLEGYGTRLQRESEGKKAWADYLFHNVWPDSSINYKFWPNNPPEYRKASEEYARRLQGVVDETLGSLSLWLGLERHVLKEAVGGERLEYLLKINYYPPCPRPDLALGVVAHTDMSAITVLVPNEVPGLQVFKDGRWLDAEYVPNALVVHVGDQVEIVSNGRYKSVMHRTVVSRDRVRMSWPVFCSPPGEEVVGPLPQLVGDGSPARFKAKKYKDYSYCKINKLPQ